MKTKQKKERKKASPRYCKRHKLHYMSECPLCSEHKQKRIYIEVWE